MTDKTDELGFGRWSEKHQCGLIPLWLMPFLADEIEVECIDGEKEADQKARWITITDLDLLEAYG